jgi:hypothetical protein
VTEAPSVSAFLVTEPARWRAWLPLTAMMATVLIWARNNVVARS